MGVDQHEFSLEYAFMPSVDAEERLARAYDLILNLMLSNLAPEEDAVGALPNAADAGGIFHVSPNRITRPLRAGHAR